MTGSTIAEKMLAYGDKKLAELMAAGAALKKIESEPMPDGGTPAEWQEAFAARHNAAGQCRGICIALFLLYKPTWANPDEVAEFLKQRARAKKAGDPLPEPPAASAVVAAKETTAAPAKKATPAKKAASTVAETELGKRAQANADAATARAAARSEETIEGSEETEEYTPPGGVKPGDAGNTDRVTEALRRAKAATQAAAAGGGVDQ